MPPLAVDRSLARHFSRPEDPRCELKRRHKLVDMIVMAIAAVQCGANGWVGIAALIRARGAHYVLALKGNQERLAEEVEEAFIDADAQDYAGAISELVETTDAGHGRRETRRYRTLANLEGLKRGALWEGMNIISPGSCSRIRIRRANVRHQRHRIFELVDAIALAKHHSNTISWRSWRRKKGDPGTGLEQIPLLFPCFAENSLIYWEFNKARTGLT